MFSFLSKTSPAQRTELVCRITSYAVTTIITRTFFHRGGTAQTVVLTHHQTLLSLTPHEITQDDLEKRTAHALRESLTHARSITPVYDTITCFLGEPWTTSTPRTTRMERTRNFKITQKIIDDLIARETKLFEQEVMREYEGKEEVGLLEISQPLVTAHGYLTHQYLNEHAKNIALHQVYTLVPVSIVQRLSEVFLDMFHRQDISYRAYDHVLFPLMHQHPQGVLFFCGGITTSITVYEQGIPALMASLPVGLHRFEQSLMEQGEMLRNMIPETLELIRDQYILTESRNAYHQKIYKAYTAWSNLLPHYLEHMKRHAPHLHQPVILLGDPSWVHLLAPLVARDLMIPVEAPTLTTPHEFIISQGVTPLTPEALFMLRAVTPGRK